MCHLSLSVLSGRWREVILLGTVVRTPGDNACLRGTQDSAGSQYVLKKHELLYSNCLQRTYVQEQVLLKTWLSISYQRGFSLVSCHNLQQREGREQASACMHLGQNDLWAMDIFYLQPSESGRTLWGEGCSITYRSLQKTGKGSSPVEKAGGQETIHGITSRACR